MTYATISAARLTDAPEPSASEMLTRARRLVSDRVGLVRAVLMRELGPDEPAVHWASAVGADMRSLVGFRGGNLGGATSVDRDRAVLKAVGECVERYCSAIYDDEALVLETYDGLGSAATPPGAFAILSEHQYAQAGCRMKPFTRTTPVRWVLGHSLVDDVPTYVPAAFVYVPYWPAPGETSIWDPISTGQACGPTWARAAYKGLLEGVERDALMIVWHNRLARPHIDLDSVTDPFARRFLDEIERIPVRCQALLLTLDIPVPVVLCVATSESGRPPLRVLGLGTDLDPRGALVAALEEICLGIVGMARFAHRFADYRPATDFSDVTDLDRHGLAHALDPRLLEATEFLTQPAELLTLDEIEDRSTARVLDNLELVLDGIQDAGLDAVAVDLTTEGVDEAGFKVVRVVVPGLQGLDVDHNHRYLGGRRLYEVPVQEGLLDAPPSPDALNPYPHPFP